VDRRRWGLPLWSNTGNWSSSWTGDSTVNLTFGSGFASGQPHQNISSYSSGVQIGSLTIDAPSPVTISGNRIFLNGDLSALGSGSHSITAPLSFQTAAPNLNVADAGGTLRVGTLANASGSAATFTKTGAGDLVLAASLSGTQTVRLLEGTLTAGTFNSLSGTGNRAFTGPVLRLEGGTLRALGPESVPPNLPPWISPATYFATYSVPVSPDVIVSGSVTLGSGSTPAQNARLNFGSGVRLEQDSHLTLNNETVLMRHVEGAHRLTVAGTGRLILSTGTSPADIPAERPTELVVDGGAIGIRHAVGLPAAVTLTNGGRLDALQFLTLTGSQAVTIAGSGIIRNAGLGDMTLNADQLRGDGTLSVQSMLPTNLPPNLPPNFFIQPGRVRLNGANTQFTGDTLIDGGELVVTAGESLGTALLSGGTQAVTIRSGALNLSGAGALLTPDLSRVVVERGGILRLGSSTGFTVTPQTVPTDPVAGMISIVSGSLGGTGVVPLADGAAIQYAGGGTGLLQTGVQYVGTEPGIVTLAGAYIPNRGFSWGGILNVTGTVTEQVFPVTLQISGAGVLLSGSQGHSGGTIVTNGRLDVTNPGAFGQDRTVLLEAGSQLDLRMSVSSTTQLPIIAPGSAGMIGLGVSGQVTNAVVQAMDRGLNSIGPAHSTGDYIYSSGTLAPAFDNVYRFGTVSAVSAPPGSSGAFLVPKAFKITQADVLTGSAAVVVGMAKGPALGNGGSILTINADQPAAGPFTVLPDFFLATEQNPTQPFGTAGVSLRGKLLATGSQGSFVNLASPITFQRGAELWLDYAQNASVDRWNDSRPIPLNAGALRLRGNGNTGLAVTETVGVLEYSGRSRIFLDQNQATPSSSNVMALTVASLAPTGPGSPSLEIFKVRGTEKILVTNAPTRSGSANLVPGVYDARNHDFVTWNALTTELIPATATHTNTFTGSDGGSYVNVTTSGTVSGTATAHALRTAASINGAGSALIIGDGTSGMLIARGPTPAYTPLTIVPDLTFFGTGQFYVAPNTYLNLAGRLDAPDGLVKLGAGDLHLRGGPAPGGGGSIRLREGRLIGSGTFAGWSIIAEGSSILAPGDSPGVAEVEFLESNDETVWEFELQARDDPLLISDKWIVTGDLILNGFVDVINWVDPDPTKGGVGTMQEGIYELISWGGSLSGDGLTLRTMPDGFFGQLMIDELRKVVELEVSLTGSFVAVPEPSTWALVLSAAIGCGLARGRRSRPGWRPTTEPATATGQT
jgi:autotransporter-associated beta strand protein